MKRSNMFRANSLKIDQFRKNNEMGKNIVTKRVISLRICSVLTFSRFFCIVDCLLVPLTFFALSDVFMKEKKRFGPRKWSTHCDHCFIMPMIFSHRLKFFMQIFLVNLGLGNSVHFRFNIRKIILRLIFHQRGPSL